MRYVQNLQFSSNDTFSTFDNLQISTIFNLDTFDNFYTFKTFSNALESQNRNPF